MRDIKKLIHERDFRGEEAILHIFAKFCRSGTCVVIAELLLGATLIQRSNELEKDSRPSNYQEPTGRFFTPAMKTALTDVFRTESYETAILRR
ncbi:MAG TPA: hypothetical protein VK641_13000 [Terriglobales bacterium]|nr:hypothetical protein [Terriglobales bacterium]